MVKFKKLSGLPIGGEYHIGQVIPFSMSRAVYCSLNTVYETGETIPVPEALESGQFMYRLNPDRSFLFEKRDKLMLSLPGGQEYGWKVFTFEGYNGDIYVIDIDHHNEKVFGYDASKRQFFRVKMHLSEYDARFVLYDRGYLLSDFLY